jgi:sirohydrochlorin ferrochelatase
MSVILAAHGAGDGSEANRRLLALADALRVARPGVRFGCAFWKGTPSFEDAARSSRGQGPVVVPIMASGGYYARRRLPEEWAKGDPSRSFVIAPPIGTLPAFPRVLATKVGVAVTDMMRRGLNPVVLLVGHGTTRILSSGDAARSVRDELALTFPHTEILTAFLDESPHLSDVAGSLGDRPVVAAPLLLGGGPHVLVDLVGALTAPRASSRLGHMTETLKILPPILEWPELASLTLEAIDSASGVPASFAPNPRAWRTRGRLARRRRSSLGSATHPNSGHEGGGGRARLPVAMSVSMPLRAGSPSVP